MTLQTTDTMTAVVQDRYGTADTWRLDRVDVPSIGDDEVLVQVHAAGLDRGVWHLMLGQPYVVRPVYGMRRPKQPVPGLDVAGTVVRVGSAVTRLAVGDEVFGIGRGTYAEYAVALESKLAVRPPSLPVVDASVLAVSGSTALQAVRHVARVQSGQRVLVLGASGGVGSFTVQLCRDAGAEVTGVCSAAKAELVRGFGATKVLNYSSDELDDGSRYDVILDIGGCNPVSRLRRLMTRTGTLVIIGGESGARWTGGLGRQLRASLRSPFVSHRLTMLIAKETYVDYDVLAALVTEGRLAPAVDEVYPLADAARAMSDLAAGRARGKLALTVR